MKFSTPKKCPLITKFTYLLLLLVLFNTTVDATTYYVSTSGNNSNNGTSPSTPWQNFNKVQSMANSNSFKPGDNILFKKGDSFTGTIYWSSIYGNNGSSGTANNPITLGTYGTGAKPIFQVPAGSNSATIFSFIGVKYIVVDGFNITDLTFPIADKVSKAPCGIAIQIGSYGEITSNYCTVRNTDISNVGLAVVIVGDFNTIDSTTMTNLKNVKNTPGGDDDYGANGVTITGNDNIITHNYFSGNWAASYDYGWNGGALEMFDACSRNKVLYNTITDCGGVAEFGAYVSSTVSSDNLFAYNKITNSGMLSWCNLSGSYTTNVNNVQYFNNVIIENSDSRFSGPNNGAGVNTNPYPSTELFAYNGNPPSTVYNLKNNVFILSTGIDVVRSSSVAKTTHNNNIYQLSNGSVTSFPLNSSEINSTAIIFTNTTNPDPSLWDFYPASGSPAIGFGQNVGIPLDFAGIAVGTVPNAGVYESNPGNNVPGPLKIVATPGAIACNGATTTVVVSATGGTQPYTGTGTFTVTAGAYNYTVKDAKGDSATTSITIIQPTLLTLNVAAGTINVYGGTTSITATATGGTAAYTYKLNNGSYQASNIFNNVASGSYTITVKDAKGCTQSKSISITQPAAPPTLTASSTSTSIMCNGSNTTVTVSATGGTQPYTGTGTFTVTAGTYNYTVTDAGGQTATTSITVSQPTLLTLSVSAGTINTIGGTTTITANANGGTTAYTYKLNNGTYQASNVFNNVASGSYTITVKDANGCTQSKSINITEPGAPAALNASATAGTITCNGSNTTVTVSATGGTQPYTGTGTFTVTAGTYNYTVTDAGGQTATTSITVTQPTLLTLNVTAGTINTYGGTTTITANANGGTTAYTYKLNNGTYQASNVFNNVASGSYTITVKDANGCTQSKSINITEPGAPAALNASATAGTISCNGSNTTVTVSATGGTQPYTGTGTFTVTAGTYNYTVTDAGGQTATTSITVSQPTLLTLSVSAGTINTYGGTTTITANANGGTAAYTYKLNNGSYQASNVFNNVASGSYTITVKDANGCSQSKSINITEPAAPSALNINVTAGTISCYGSTTTVTVTASGGTAPYSGVGTFTKTAGTYSYTVTDAAGVKATKSITLTQPEVLNASIAVGAIQSYGGTTNITITATGGTAPYQYSVSASSFQSQNSFSSIKAGSYTVVVKDAKGCTSTKVISVSQPAEQISINTKSKAAGCAGGADGSIEASVKSGGTGPYTYNINNGSFGNSNSFANLIAGTYKVSVKDSKGLVSSTNVAIADGTRKCKAIYLTAFPNPTTTEFSVNIESDDSKNDVYITVINLLGQKVYSAIGKINQKNTFGRDFKAGAYILRVKQGSYSETVKLIKFK